MDTAQHCTVLRAFGEMLRTPSLLKLYNLWLLWSHTAKQSLIRTARKV